MPVTSCQCIIGIEEYRVSAILLKYDDGLYSQGYAQIKEVFKALIEGDILQPYKSEYDFRLSNHGDDGKDIGYNIHRFDIRYQKKFESAQPVKVEIIFQEKIPAGLYGYALVLTNK